MREVPARQSHRLRQWQQPLMQWLMVVVVVVVETMELLLLAQLLQLLIFMGEVL